MKNAGMAGAVALVGIGLITIGVSRWTPPAQATTSSQFPLLGGGGFPNSPEEAGCPVELFEPVLRPFLEKCPMTGRRAQNHVIQVDLLGLGYDQPIFLPSAYDNCLFAPMQIITRSEVITMATWLPDLYGSGWGNDCWISAEGLLDVDGDGRLDLVLSSFSGGTKVFAWLRNIYDAPARLPADLNHDGKVDGADLGDLFSQWTG